MSWVLILGLNGHLDKRVDSVRAGVGNFWGFRVPNDLLLPQHSGLLPSVSQSFLQYPDVLFYVAMRRAFTGRCRIADCKYPKEYNVECDHFFANEVEAQNKLPGPREVCICGCLALQHEMEIQVCGNLVHLCSN